MVIIRQLKGCGKSTKQSSSSDSRKHSNALPFATLGNPATSAKQLRILHRSKYKTHGFNHTTVCTGNLLADTLEWAILEA
jgi:hypothetical protein